jgi:hypothetical protein
MLLTEKYVPRMFLHFTPLDLSCWYSTSVKDGVLREREDHFQALWAKSVFSGVSLTILMSSFISIVSLEFVISLLKHVSSEDFGSKS